MAVHDTLKQMRQYSLGPLYNLFMQLMAVISDHSVVIIDTSLLGLKTECRGGFRYDLGFLQELCRISPKFRKRIHIPRPILLEITHGYNKLKGERLSKARTHLRRLSKLFEDRVTAERHDYKKFISACNRFLKANYQYYADLSRPDLDLLSFAWWKASSGSNDVVVVSGDYKLLDAFRLHGADLREFLLENEVARRVGEIKLYRLDQNADELKIEPHEEAISA
jgi:hypothetical protein